MSRLYYIDDYKFGIICALPLERTAIEAMLDDIHEPQPAIAGDNNVYTFGRIGHHKVIVASLGVGTYGTVSAAGVANDLRRSYPLLRYGLMIGIAGGVPRPGSRDGDIRLGDIVIGCVNGAPSVVNYSFGKGTDNGFVVRSELAEPPEALSRAVAALEVQHQRLGPTYLTHLSDMLRKNPRLNQPMLKRDYYNIPDVPDRLFRAQPLSAVYEGLYRIGAVSGGQEVVRGLRYLRKPPSALKFEKFIRIRDDGFADYPAAFRGSIGSADVLMKSAIHRDAVFDMVKKQRNSELLCYEMEASGIVKGWPCLIIRGICDYSDSHKNDDWQNFAAATAAAYAKDLLIRIPPEIVAVARPISEVVRNGQSELAHYRMARRQSTINAIDGLRGTTTLPNGYASSGMNLGSGSSSSAQYHPRVSDNERQMTGIGPPVDVSGSIPERTGRGLSNWSPISDGHPRAASISTGSFTSRSLGSAVARRTSVALSADQKESVKSNKALISAALAGKLEQVRAWHMNGGDINSSDGPLEAPTALAAAISQYRRLQQIRVEPLQAVKESIEHHVMIFSQIIQYLVSNGAKWDREDPEIESTIKHTCKETDYPKRRRSRQYSFPYDF